MKKSIFLFATLFSFMLHMQAQSVSYSYRLLSEESCTVSYTPVVDGDSSYIVVSLNSEKLIFGDNPTMMVRFFNTDKIIQLNGIKLDETTKNGMIPVGNIYVPYTEVKSTALFKVSEYEMSFFKYGVEKIRLSTFPIMHERTFKKDKIGMDLYQSYQYTKKKAKSF